MELDRIHNQINQLKETECKDCGADDLTELNCYGCPTFGKLIDLQMELHPTQNEMDETFNQLMKEDIS